MMLININRFQNLLECGFEDKIIDDFIKEYLPLIINELSEKEKKIIYFRYGFINNKPISKKNWHRFRYITRFYFKD